jgi:trk system potassium uptake protein TrkH
VALFRWIGRSVSFRQRMIMQDLFAHTPRADILSLVRSVVFFTLGAEAIGAVLLAIHWSPGLPPGRAAYAAIFHAVSAFCNAGFALYPDSLVGFSGDLPVNLVMGSLIVVGGLGFPVLYDLQQGLVHRRGRRLRLAIHTKAVLVTTLVLIAAGALLFACLEREALAAAPTPLHRWLAPFFQSITCRTAGFNTVDMATLQEATLAMMVLLMFVGASPGSCGGGVKTTTLALITLFTVSRIRRMRRVNLFRKSVPTETVTRSVSLLLVSFGIIAVVLFMLLVGDTVTGREAFCAKGLFLGYLFETVSAFGTVGLSLGITPELSVWGKSWIILTMIVGRVGVLTFAYIIVGAGTANGVAYAEENLMIG